VLSGGAAVSNTIRRGVSAGSEEVFSGGQAIGTLVSSGAVLNDFGGVVSNTTVLSGGREDVSTGTAIGTVLSGGSANIYGTDIGATILSGGLETVFSNSEPGFNSSTASPAACRRAAAAPPFWCRTAARSVG
jgi:autotransporter passenger strand-loop-strand repeat protein